MSQHHIGRDVDAVGFAMQVDHSADVIVGDTGILTVETARSTSLDDLAHRPGQDVGKRRAGRHAMTACAWCGVSDQTVASSITADGHRWPPLCAKHSAMVRRESKTAPRRESKR